MDLQSGGISFPLKKAGIYLSSSLLPPFHLPFLSNLKGQKQCAYTHAGEGRTKKGQKIKNPNPRTKSLLHKRRYACTQNATRDREMQMKQRKQTAFGHSDTETKSIKEN